MPVYSTGDCGIFTIDRVGLKGLEEMYLTLHLTFFKRGILRSRIRDLSSFRHSKKSEVRGSYPVSVIVSDSRR